MTRLSAPSPRSSGCAALLALLAFAPDIAAQRRRRDPDEREYRSIARVQVERPEEALTRYTALHARSGSPRALAQIAGVEAQMGRWVSAEEHLRRALERADDPWISRSRSALERMRDQIAEHVSELTVVANVTGATLRVNGADAGALPLAQPVRVLVGDVVLDLIADGHEPLRQTVRAQAGRTRAELTLVPRPPPVAAPAPAPAVAVIPPVAPPPPPVSPAPVRRESQPRRNATLATLGVVGVSVGALGIGVGVLGIVLRNGHVNTFTEANCARRGGTVIGGETCQAEYDAGVGMETLATVGFVAGGAFVAAGITALLLSPRGREEGASPRVTLRCGGGPGTFGLACGGSF